MIYFFLVYHTLYKKYDTTLLQIKFQSDSQEEEEEMDSNGNGIAEISESDSSSGLIDGW